MAGPESSHVIETAVFLLCLVLSHTGMALSLNNSLRVPDEQLLYEKIMGDYVKWVRPMLNYSKPIRVKFAMRLNQIVSLDERQQVLTTNVFLDQTWTDPALAWDPTVFKDVRALRIPADQVWRPDTFIYNNADNGSTGFIDGTYVQIRHTGAVSWPVPVRLRSSCVVKITYFPFDRQYCMVRFGSWIYSQNFVDYEVRPDVSSVDLSSFTKNSEWELLAMRLEKSVVSRTRGLGLHPHLTAVIYLKRNTFFYLFNIIVPCCMLSILTLMTFWLPPTSCEKVTLGLNVFLAFSMFMLLIAEEVPASSDAVPLIGVYLCVVMTMTSMSVLCAVLVTNLHNRGSKLKPAPRWLARLFIGHLAGPMRVSRDVHLLASTIYLPQHSQFFFLHDDRWTCKEPGASDCSSSSDYDSTREHQDQTGHRLARQLDTQNKYSMEATNETEVNVTNQQSPINAGCKWTPTDRMAGYSPGLGSELNTSGPATLKGRLATAGDQACSGGNCTNLDNSKQRTGPDKVHLWDSSEKRVHKLEMSPEFSNFGQLVSQEYSTETSGEKVAKKIISHRSLYEETSLCGTDSLENMHGTSPQVSLVNRAVDKTSSPKVSVDQNSIYCQCSLELTKTSHNILSAPDGTFLKLLPGADESNGNGKAQSVVTATENTLASQHTQSDEEDSESEVWVLRDEFKQTNSTEVTSKPVYVSDKPHPTLSKNLVVPKHLPFPENHKSDTSTGCNSRSTSPKKIQSEKSNQTPQNADRVLKRARFMIAEWCIIAKVMDRILFILCLLATLFAYIFILIVVPIEFGSKTGNVTFVNTVNTGRYMWGQS